MMIKKHCLAGVFAFQICFWSTAISQVDNAQLLMTGTYHGDEVVTEPGDKWLAMVPSGNGYALEKARIKIEFVKDDIIDEDGAKTAKKVSIDLNKQPLFLVRGIQGIENGRVETVTAKLLRLEINSPTQLKLTNGRIYKLSVACDENSPKSVDHFKECPLTLTTQFITQTIHNFEIYNPPDRKPIFAGDASPAVLWAGDLNTDGALDLLIDISNHYNTAAPTLFLSSTTQTDALVYMAATFATSGC